MCNCTESETKKHLPAWKFQAVLTKTEIQKLSYSTQHLLYTLEMRVKHIPTHYSVGTSKSGLFSSFLWIRPLVPEDCRHDTAFRLHSTTLHSLGWTLTRLQDSLRSTVVYAFIRHGVPVLYFGRTKSRCTPLNKRQFEGYRVHLTA